MGAEPTLHWALQRPVDQFGDATATVDIGTGERRTWIETADRVNGVASGLLGLDLDDGDRIGVLMLNSARHFELWFAIPFAGMVMNDLNYRLAVEELAFICDDSQVRVLFVDDSFLDVGRQLLDRVESLATLVWTGPGDAAPDGCLAYESLAATARVELPDAQHDTLAAIFYTGGTTGLPKGAMLTHRNLTSNAIHGVAVLAMTHRDTYLHAGPQFHLADGSMTYALSWVGGTHVFVPAFEPTAVVRALADERCTLALLVPTMLNMVLASGALDGADLSALRLLMYGASPMPAEVQRRVASGFGCDMMQLYGMTEASPIATSLDAEHHRRGMDGEEPFASRLRSAGSAVPGVRCEIRREDGSLADVGEPGEIYIQGPNIMAGYWNRPEETAHALVDGWYRSGDVAWRDAGGYLYVVDRAKDMIISGGENVYTSEVENAVYLHPGVAEAAVYGIPHDKFGETVHAEVVPKPGATITEEELIAHCREHIAGYKLPRSVTVRNADDPLPKSGAGKILKRELRAPHWEGHDRQVG
ncbi:MAG: long-chain-fatty-acid--CoA ligase [Actinomycetota bacterium]|jgi:long-chain acyl-CoA synthetase|nr:long-chain-fatty-acid--CoA ligase [Actinomycetota bacterium]MDA3015797.1 long-chain-fatty-acid--CoA ligase [Actinomycetota bacterium]MDA3028730.1 long-chain-fatty-acid--CoA ligase [Actinomycetota bacterium]